MKILQKYRSASDTFHHPLRIAFTLLLGALTSFAAPLGTEFTYQGRLDGATGPANGRYDFTFALHLTASGGTPVGTVTAANIPVTNGIFTAAVDFGAGIFNGNSYWLQLSVRTNGNSAFTTVAPRQPLTSTPNAQFAVLANSVPNGSIDSSKLAANAVATAALQNNSVLGTKIANAQVVRNVNGLQDAVTLAAGANTTITPTGNTLTIAGSSDWKIGGNGGTTPGNDFLGTTDAQPMEFKVNGKRALRLEPDRLGGDLGNVIGGSIRNQVINGALGAVIGGGGPFLFGENGNTVGGDFGTIGGGRQNSVLIAEGTIAGGRANTASALNATVSGGYGNTASGGYASVIGGIGNTASGLSATVIGGENNLAANAYTLAAGHQAKANHAGTFVWADSTATDFASTTSNQFLIRASGGVGIGTTSPSSALDVVGGASGNGIQGTSFDLLASGVYGQNNVGGYGVAGRTIGAGAALFGDNASATGWAGFFNGNVQVNGKQSFGSQTRQMLNLYNTSYGIGVQAANLYFRTDSSSGGGGFAWYQGGTHNDAAGNPGGGQTLMRLDHTGTLNLGNELNWGNSRLTPDQGGSIELGPTFSSGRLTPFIDFHFGNTLIQDYNVRLINDEDGQLSAYGNFNVTGNASVCSLTIRGGCDLAEPFRMSGQQIPKGAVVIIDEENPGHLKMSTSAFDTRVAGIVSGAGGVSPGISLHQEGVLEGGQNVALSGRVYVQADASGCPIKPGDLLTTSDLPGHAMKVTDHAKSQGAIIGKAMTALKEGKGLVLVLVTLQ